MIDARTRSSALRLAYALENLAEGESNILDGIAVFLRYMDGESLASDIRALVTLAEEYRDLIREGQI